MTQTSAYCSFQSINSSHWAVSVPDSKLLPDHPSCLCPPPPLSLTSRPPTWTQECIGFESATWFWPAHWSHCPNQAGTYSASSSQHTYMYACTKTPHKNSLPPGQSPVPCGPARGRNFCWDRGPRGGQRASQTHGGLWPSVFLMALSPVIIDLNSAIRHARGKTKPLWSDDGSNSGTWPESKNSGSD